MIAALRRIPVALAVCALLALVCGLYLPFIGNPPIFDDKLFFLGEQLSYYATHPIGMYRRAPAFASLAFTQVVWGDIESHRLVSLGLHAACALVLYALAYRLLLLAGSRESAPAAADDRRRARAWAFVTAALFAVHPVAVYGAGYLVQRSIVLSTLFGLLALLLFVRGLQRRSHADALSAAVMFNVSVLSKEHSVGLLAIALLALPLVQVDRRFALRHAALYVLACLPSIVVVVLLNRWVIGQAYEPEMGAIAAQVSDQIGHAGELTWPVSAVTQAGLFFRYVGLWLWPRTGEMSIDVRVDFLEQWSVFWIVVKVAAFVAVGIAGLWLFRRRGRYAIAGFGVLYTWVLFLPEFSTVRFQEPFVLYRSYLWGPGILLTAVAVLSRFRVRAAVVVFVAACPVLLYQAHDRLVSFSSGLRLWEDAVAKLPSPSVPWGSRTLYELGREYLYSGQPDRALQVTDRCMAGYPESYDCYYARGAIHLQLQQYEQALPFFVRASELRPALGAPHQRLGMALEGLDRIEEAKDQYRLALKLGFAPARNNILQLEDTGAGVLPAKSRKPGIGR
jgi:protein O-mannosyl-transferase